MELRKGGNFEKILGGVERRGEDESPHEAGSVTARVAAHQGDTGGIIEQVRVNAVNRRVERIESNIFTVAVIGGDGIPAWWVEMAFPEVVRSWLFQPSLVQSNDISDLEDLFRAEEGRPGASRESDSVAHLFMAHERNAGGISWHIGMQELDVAKERSSPKRGILVPYFTLHNHRSFITL